MKKILLIPCLLLTIFLHHCKKSKDDNGPNIKKGLIAYFPLNDSFEDSLGNCEITSSVSTVLPAFDRYHESSALFFADKGRFTFTTKNWKAAPITVSFWIKCSDLTGIDNFFLQSNNDILDMHQSDDKVGMGVKTATKLPRAYAAITKQWTHYAATYDGEFLVGFMNGNPVISIKKTGNPGTITEISVGSYLMNGVYWNGAIDDLRFYDRVLNDDEIEMLAGL